MNRYVTKGMHVRTESGVLKIYKSGSEIVPTEFELVMFPDKFVSVNMDEADVDKLKVSDETPENGTTVEAELTEAQVDKEIGEMLVTVNGILENEEEWQDDVVEEAKALAKRNPQKLGKKINLMEDLKDFVEQI